MVDNFKDYIVIEAGKSGKTMTWYFRKNNYYNEISDSDYIGLIYKALLQRKSDKEGYHEWIIF